MKTVRLVSVTMFVIALLVGCASLARPAVPAVDVGRDDVAASGEVTAANSLLLLEAINADRTVQPGADEVFDFKMVNTTGQALTVVVALEHKGGERWRTSLCVEKQCLLGDGSEPSITDPVILPPYLEQPFQAHVFVDAAARPGQSTALTLRVEPLTEAAKPQSVILAAQVDSP
jgi:hypothetical protein